MKIIVDVVDGQWIKDPTQPVRAYMYIGGRDYLVRKETDRLGGALADYGHNPKWVDPECPSISTSGHYTGFVWVRGNILPECNEAAQHLLKKEL